MNYALWRHFKQAYNGFEDEIFEPFPSELAAEHRLLSLEPNVDSIDALFEAYSYVIVSEFDVEERTIPVSVESLDGQFAGFGLLNAKAENVLDRDVVRLVYRFSDDHASNGS